MNPTPRPFWKIATIGPIERMQAIFLAIPFLMLFIVCIPAKAIFAALAVVAAAVVTFWYAARMCRNDPYGISNYIASIFAPRMFRAIRNLNQLFRG
jgi:hypothetical protein